MDTIWQHFRKDEQPFIEMATGWVREVENTYSPKLTGFLDPRQQFIVESLARSVGILVSSYGAFQNAERQRILLYPDYFVPESEDFQVTVFKVVYAAKFLTLEHRDILGSLLSVGIDRSKFGDIRLSDEDVQFSVAREIKDYVTVNLTSIGKAKVTLEEVQAAENWIMTNETWKESSHTVSSLRLDVIVAALMKASRQKAASLIHGERVKVNWTVRDQPSFELQESDILSIRGGGRFKVMAIEGRTRKDKLRLVIGKLE
ncbi:RNA-binding protein [Sporosarcina sp. 179-K 3D1 HS]|uniref:YlmH family RNA-binding protein n=1 Tax=Sporosarcina sp. 179-K 3D1 HS TaxID=3232169 RepID=UPI0039A1240D